MRLSSKVFLLAVDDTLHGLANTAFMRMLRREDVARVPDFAGQRVRQVSVTIKALDGAPLRVVRWTFSVLEFDTDGFLDVERLSAQQFARFADPFEGDESSQGEERRVIDAARRFVARGGTWEPDAELFRRIEAAALGQMSVPRVRVVR